MLFPIFQALLQGRKLTEKAEERWLLLSTGQVFFPYLPEWLRICTYPSLAAPDFHQVNQGEQRECTTLSGQPSEGTCCSAQCACGELG